MKQVIYMITILILLVLCASCKKQGRNNEYDINSQSKNVINLEIQDDTENDVDVIITEKNESNTIDKKPYSIAEENKGKAVYTDYSENVPEELEEYKESNSMNNEREECTINYITNNIIKKGEDASQNTYVYSESLLRSSFVPNCDYSRWLDNSGTRNFLSAIFTSFPTEAIRKADNGMYYLIYDLDTNVRLFSWFFEGEIGSGWYEQFGYPIYMAETLSYNDFAGIEIGDDVLEVEAIDTKVTDIYMSAYRDEKEQHTLNRIDNGYPPRSLHLLTDGLLVITYGRDGDNFPITDIEFHEDFTIDTVAGPQCCKINPLDYVTQG